MTGRCRLWRWAVVVWVTVVVVGGGLTLWLQDSAQPSGGEETHRTPSLPEGWETLCPSPTAEPDGGRVIHACAFISG
ncbi:hypothetical protein [Streptomyces fulvoviolaceus]|uniref:hypothetical protein n=1 Tax=Streptomyces fulvoviolaceus TaxID=285535 RepID=UPI0021BF2C2B|nr:hypothetical protein [Streptomyces fulvoviolaceus]MCT9077622.1 hypothetical protein [Streptomyces fulvoviolaceus]